MTNATKGILYAVVTGLCWAVLAIGLKYALHFTSTGTIVWVRLAIAFFSLLTYFTFQKPDSVRKVFKRPPILVVIAGLFLSMNYYFYMRGLEMTSASNAQVMIQLGPLLLLLVGVFYFKEHLGFKQWMGIIIASLGFIFYNWDQILVSLQNVSAYIEGNLFIGIGALTWAVFAALQKIQLQKGWTPQEINLLVYGVCFLALGPVANLSELAPLDAWQWLVLILLGLNTLVAYGAFAEALNLVPASLVSLIIAVNPLLTIFLVTLFDHFGATFISAEPIHWRGYLGAVLVVLGVSLAVYFKNNRSGLKEIRIQK